MSCITRWSMRRLGHSRVWVRNLALVLAGVVTLATSAKLLGRYPYFELATHFPVQYAIVLLTSAILLIAVRSRWAIAPILGAAINLAFVGPYFSLGGEEPRPGRPLRLMVLNVYHPNRNVDSVVHTIRAASPDLLTLQEVTWTWWEALRPRLADYEYIKAEPGPAGAGIVFLSRLPLESAEVVRFTGWTQPSIFAVVSAGDVKLSVLSMHPHKPTRALNFGARNRQFAAAARMLSETPGPRVLMGDLNCSPWSPYFVDLLRDSGLEDPRLGRGLLATWPVPMPSLGRIPIDHVLVSDEVDVQGLQTLSTSGSDHCALVADVVVVNETP